MLGEKIERGDAGATGYQQKTFCSGINGKAVAQRPEYRHQCSGFLTGEPAGAPSAFPHGVEKGYTVAVRLVDAEGAGEGGLQATAHHDELPRRRLPGDIRAFQPDEPAGQYPPCMNMPVAGQYLTIFNDLCVY